MSKDKEETTHICIIKETTSLTENNKIYIEVAGPDLNECRKHAESIIDQHFEELKQVKVSVVD